MRLSVLEEGHRTRAKLFLAVARRLAGGEEADDVFKLVLYRPDLLGGPAWTGAWVLCAVVRPPPSSARGARQGSWWALTHSFWGAPPPPPPQCPCGPRPCPPAAPPFSYDC